MNKNALFKACFAALCLASAAPTWATWWTNQTVNAVQVDGRSCLFFTLSGVSQADPVAPGQAWFALPVSAPNYQFMASTILSAKLSRKPFQVMTDGTVSCGYAAAVQVGFN